MNSLKSQAQTNLKDTHIDYFPIENAIELFYKGEALETTNCEHPNLDDRILIDPLVHGHISNHELKYTGVVFQN